MFMFQRWMRAGYWIPIIFWCPLILVVVIISSQEWHDSAVTQRARDEYAKAAAVGSAIAFNEYLGQPREFARLGPGHYVIEVRLTNQPDLAMVRQCIATGDRMLLVSGAPPSVKTFSIE